MASSFILADQFLQMSMYVPSMELAYGPGEHRNSIPVDMKGYPRFALWARDMPPMENSNLYGVHNFMLGLSRQGRAFGIFMLNSNAQEVAVQAHPSLSYRTIGGILDFFVFTGPSPASVITQYQELIGRPQLPPYWSLGFHLCRYGYENLADVRDTLMRNLQSLVPLDAQWVDIDYMNSSKDFTVSRKFKGLGDFVKQMRQLYDVRSVMMLDPAICSEGGDDYWPYKTGLEADIFVKDNRTGEPLVGEVWPGLTVFPDFTHPNIGEWWGNALTAFHETVPFDGIWIDMNEPASFVDGSTTGCSKESRLDNPPYTPPVVGGRLESKTICPSAQHFGRVAHYDLHNLYGYSEAKVTQQHLQRLKPGKRQFLLTRSSFAGSGRHTNHWTGDNLSDWPEMLASIGQIINFNMFGIPMTGADICGFRGQASEELCIRWSQLGAFYPFSRNHNELGQPPQDPAAWSFTATEYISTALQMRYHLLPYLYSLFYRAHLNGTTVARPLSFQFPDDVITHGIVRQFLLGPCLLITPVLEPNTDRVTGYLPKGEWVNLATGHREGGYRAGNTGEWKMFPAPLSTIPVHVRAGCILPMHTKAYSSLQARQTGLGITAVVDRRSQSAQGELFWDDGETEDQAYTYLEFRLTGQTLTARPTEVRTRLAQAPAKTDDLFLNFVLILGLGSRPSGFWVNGAQEKFFYDGRRDALSYSSQCQCILLSRQLNVTWTMP
ncbi:unnamed protein product [Protopolystoma xenopodis]|uniref:Uncharacterized protein n=1 Tax=Protopolystoma xenopodis TaxID=117903 RepID=A0A3S5BQ59_9PLAT|nr:unnamed protein product [Protopolystoma xenopodis]